MAKSKFNINKYKDSQSKCYAMHCETEEEARIFLKYLHSQGRKWVDNVNYMTRMSYETYGSETCYFFNEGTYGGRDRMDISNEILLSFSDYDWEEYEDKELTLTDKDVVALDNFLSSFVNQGVSL